jgi:membrane protein YdbS with pleckstrin-like domain
MLPIDFDPSSLTLLPGENIVSVMRKHWFILFIKIMPFTLLFFLPFIVLAFVPAANLSQATVATIIFFIAAYMLVILMVIYSVWTLYYLDIWIVTNKRIMDIEQKALFNREIKTLRMDTVQDVQVDVSNIFETLLNFGTLRVQTAGTGGTDAKIVGIPDPALERDIIMQITAQIHNPEP